MCGRVRQSAALCTGPVLGANKLSNDIERKDDDDSDYPFGNGDDNMSPGHSALIIYSKNDADTTTTTSTTTSTTAFTTMFQKSRATFGCIARSGTFKKPLPPGASKHFADKMFNAITDEPLAVSYSNMLRKGDTCVIPLEGFYEWTSESKLEGGGKQPYYISPKSPSTPHLLFAGFYKDVPTGSEENPTLRTFSICTTRAYPSMRDAIHSRMPLILNEEEAVEWLRAGTLPSEGHKINLVTRLANKCSTTDMLTWWPVTKKLNKIGNDVGKEPWKEVKLDRGPSVTGFFTKISSPILTISGDLVKPSPKPAVKDEEEELPDVPEPLPLPAQPPATPPKQELNERGFNSPKKSAIPVNWDKSPLHGKWKPPKEEKEKGKKKVTSKTKKSAKESTKTTPPSAKKGNLLSFFDTKPARKATAPKSQSNRSSHKEWACPACTLKNKASKKICSICETKKPSVKAKLNTLWTCSQCTLVNEPEDSKCAACGNVKK
ncbi:hypothetical protein TL16_g09758, partial [Triparma laevis f. inornata]|uniref:RanBP2-type domain-containing protein n=2 Tax=Triparma laevis TaxID=1534972 RepID=A0A9W7AHD3_9STRA